MLQEGIALARAGDKPGARKILHQVVAEEPESEHAWGWLAVCAENIGRYLEVADGVIVWSSLKVDGKT